MRGADITQEELFSYRTLEERIPGSHPIRPLRKVVDLLLRSMEAELSEPYAKTGRSSIPPECLLRASLCRSFLLFVLSDNWSSRSISICFTVGLSD